MEDSRPMKGLKKRFSIGGEVQMKGEYCPKKLENCDAFMP